MDAAQNPWRELFARWPAEMARRGMVVTSFGEQVPFSGFMLGGRLLLLERQTPNAMGGRTLIVPYENIAGLKLTEPFKPKVFQAMGFEGTLPSR